MQTRNRQIWSCRRRGEVKAWGGGTGACHPPSTNAVAAADRNNVWSFACTTDTARNTKHEQRVTAQQHTKPTQVVSHRLPSATSFSCTAFSTPSDPRRRHSLRGTWMMDLHTTVQGGAHLRACGRRCPTHPYSLFPPQTQTLRHGNEHHLRLGQPGR